MRGVHRRRPRGPRAHRPPLRGPVEDARQARRARGPRRARARRGREVGHPRGADGGDCRAPPRRRRARRREPAEGRSAAFQPSSGPPRTKAWTPVRELRSARACAWATRARPREARKVCCRRKPSRRALGPEDAVAARHAWAGALALAAEPKHSPPETPNASALAPAAHARRARACASATDLAGVMEARRHASAAIAAAPEEKAAPPPSRRRAPPRRTRRLSSLSTPLASTAIAALAMRACARARRAPRRRRSRPGRAGVGARARLRQRPRAPRREQRLASRRRRGGARGGGGPRGGSARRARARAPAALRVQHGARRARGGRGRVRGDAPADAHGAPRAPPPGTRRRSRARTATRWTCWSPRRGS